MPWLLIDSPSIQLGMLQAALAHAGIPARTHSLHLAFVDFAIARLGEAALTPAEYEALSTQWSNAGAPDWLFTGPPFGPQPALDDAAFAMLLRAAGMPVPLLDKLQRLRPLVPQFLVACADEVLATAPAMVGFTLVYSQTIASVALARAIRQRAPRTRIVFGGACCEGPMGPALLRAYPEVDFVVRGEGEAVLPALVAGLAAGDLERVQALPGVCSRRGGDVVATAPKHSQRVAMDDLPLPEYAEYFARLERSPLHTTLAARIPYQSARGCWWGMKSHCRFCGLNGTDMAFRSRDPGLVQRDLVELARRHGVLDFTVVDNIMDMRYFTTLVPALAAGPPDLALFCEVKANLTREQVSLLGRAGVRTVQPGIESLSTNVLRLMGKGTTALQNIRLLRWCQEAGMHVIWNLLYGFPGEHAADYAQMAETTKALVHLTPPNLGPLMLVRFSPYFEQPERHGLRKGAPLPFHRQLYGASEHLLDDLATVFEHSYVDGRDPERYVAPLRAAVTHWQQNTDRNRGALSYRRGPGFLIVTDARTTTGQPVRWQLDQVEGAAYLACEDGARPETVAEAVRTATGDIVTPDQIDELLRSFVSARLVCEDDGRFVSLAIATSAAWGRDGASASAGSAASALAAHS